MLFLIDVLIEINILQFIYSLMHNSFRKSIRVSPYLYHHITLFFLFVYHSSPFVIFQTSPARLSTPALANCALAPSWNAHGYAVFVSLIHANGRLSDRVKCGRRGEKWAGISPPLHPPLPLYTPPPSPPTPSPSSLGVGSKAS